MDFSKFSDENFDVKEWVNSALRIRDERTPIDVSSGLQRVHVLAFSRWFLLCIYRMCAGDVSIIETIYLNIFIFGEGEEVY